MIIYLDGENVVHQLMDVLRRTGRLKTRDDLLKVNVVDLIKRLVGARDAQIKYYTTTLQIVKTDEELEKRSQEMIAWTALWTNHLLDQGVQIVKAGRLRARDGMVCKNCGHQETVFREKGVDVRIAVDLVVDSEIEKTLVIWSSDADLVPAVEVVKERGARVKILAHKDSLTWGLARQAGEWQTYTDRQLIQAFDRKPVDDEPPAESEQIQIRLPTTKELGAVRTLRREVLENNDEPLPKPARPTAADLNPTSIHVAAFDAGTVVSVVRANPLELPGTFLITRLATRKAYRGRGIGAQLMEAVERLAIEKGAHTFVLDARPETEHFYAELGYERAMDRKPASKGLIPLRKRVLGIEKN